MPPNNYKPWRFYLAETETLDIIGRLPARGKKLSVGLNRPGNASGNISLSTNLAKHIETLRTSILAVRDSTIYWSGPVWTLNPSANANTLAFTAVGWFEELNKRKIRAQIRDAGRNVIAESEAQNFVNVDATFIARRMVEIANAQRDRQRNPRPTHIRLPSDPYPITQLRSRAVDHGVQIGSVISDLSNLEAGFDYEIDPVTRELLIHYDVVYPGSTIFGKGRDKSNIVLAYAWGPKNLSDFSYTEDADKMVNSLDVSIKNGGGHAEDTDSMNYTGFMFEEDTNLSDVTDNNIALAYAGAEVAVRAYPQKIYSVSPFSWTETNSVPRPLEDYDVGDIVRVRAKKSTINEDRNQRIFGIELDLLDNGQEKVSALQLTP